MFDWTHFFKRFFPQKKITTSITYLNKGMPGEDKAELFRIQARARRKKKDFDGALQKYNEAIACNPRSSTLLIERSEVKMIQRDTKAVMADLEKAVRLDPQNPDVYNARSQFWKKMGDEKQAQSDLEKVESLLLQKKKEATKKLGDSNSYLIRSEKKMECGDYEGALIDLDSALSLNPKEGRAYLNRAALKQGMGDQEGAKKDFQKAKECEEKEEIVS